MDTTHYDLLTSQTPSTRQCQVKQLVFDELQLEAAAQISDRNTAPEDLDYTPTEDLETNLLDDVDD